MVLGAIPIMPIHCARWTSGNPQFRNDDEPAKPLDAAAIQPLGEVRKGVAPRNNKSNQPNYNNQILSGNLFPQAAIPAHGAGGYIYIYIYIYI